jgi:transcription elongation GreA/GreB family factor
MDKLKQEKIAMWQKKLEALEKEFTETMQEKGDAAKEGDLSENAAYKMALEEADMLRARMDEMRKIILDLESK